MIGAFPRGRPRSRVGLVQGGASAWSIVGLAVVILLIWFASGAYRWQGNPIDFPHGRTIAIILGVAVQLVFLLVTVTAIRRTPADDATFLAALAAWIAARLVTTSMVPLGGDEAYHWLWARHLDWGYYDHPGMVAWLARLFAPFHGRANALVRLSPLIMTSLLPVLTAWLARLTFGDRAIARRAGLLAMLVPIFAGGVLLVPMVAVNFFWLLSVLFLWQAVVTDRTGYWLLVGLAFGAALDSNFTAVLLPVCLLAYLLLYPPDRGVLRRRGPWLAAIVGLLCFAPTLYWNAAHGWVTFGFNLLRRHSEIGFHPVSPLLYLLILAGLLSPLLAAALFVVVPAGLRHALRERSRHVLFLSCFALGPILVFLATSLILKPRPHYACTGFVPLLVLFAAACHAAKPAGLATFIWYRRSARVAGLCAMLVLGGAVVPGLVPADDAAGALRRVTGKRVSKTIAEMYGWTALGGWLDGPGMFPSSPWQKGTGTSQRALSDSAKRARLGASPLLPRAASGERPVAIIASSYAQASLIAHHSRRAVEVFSRDEGKIPYGQQIGLWCSLRTLAPGRDAIIIYAGTVADGSIAPKDYSKYFDAAEPVDTAAPGLDPRLKYFTLIRAHGYKGNFKFSDQSSPPEP